MIGLFDSGSGGLTVLYALRKKAHHADLIYLGDIANAPYGEKSTAEIIELTRKEILILQKTGVDGVVSACNSISKFMLEGAAGILPFVEMSLPTAEHMHQYTGKHFLLIATPATISSLLYEQAIEKEIQLESLAIPGLAGAIEFNNSEKYMEEILDNAFASCMSSHYDGLILGCTHYPLIRTLIKKVAKKFFGELLIIDPADAVADAITSKFDMNGSGKTRFLITQESQLFRQRIKTLFPNYVYTVEVVN